MTAQDSKAFHQVLENMDGCYGCSACVNICPVGAITMQENAEGFPMPIIDREKCTGCGACRKVCPRLNPQYPNRGEPPCYALMAADSIRKTSTSGGAFRLLADFVLQQNGVVCGAVLSEDFLSTAHELADSPAGAARMQKSKYMQSLLGNNFAEIKKLLQDGRWVLFSGCPCQAAGLKAFLKKDYDRLLLVDLVCHSVPSPGAWRAFLSELSDERKISAVDFRSKATEVGWSVTTQIQFSDGTEYLKRFKDCLWEKGSSGQLMSRKSCDICQFARTSRQGDFTIGDFWGIDQSLNDKKGTSLVLLNNNKAEKVYQKITAKAQIKKQALLPLKRAMPRNGQLYKPPKMSPGREAFFAALQSGKPYSEALEIGLNQKYDVGLLGIWYGNNFGSAMTNFALYQTVKDSGFKPLFLDIPDMLWPGTFYRDHNFSIRRFAYKHYNISARYASLAALTALNQKCDTFLVGSDQLWNYKLCASSKNFFYLDFVQNDRRRISYATSFGHDSFRGTPAQRQQVAYYMQRFHAVSVREKKAVPLCAAEFGVSAQQVIDPVFICDPVHYTNLIQQSNAKREYEKTNCRPFLSAYILDPNDQKLEVLREMARRMNLDLIIIPNAVIRKKSMRDAWKNTPLHENLDVEDWLFYLAHSQFVFTDSYHGMCFSILFERPFVCVKNPDRGAGRFEDFTDTLGLSHRIVDRPQQILDNADSLLQPIDYAPIRPLLQAERERGLQWLTNALQAPLDPQKNPPLSYDVYLDLQQDISALQQKIKQLEKNAQTLQDKAATPPKAAAAPPTLKAFLIRCLRALRRRLRRMLKK